MKRTTIKELYASPEKYADRKVTVAGWARSIRASNAFGFIELNDGRIVSGKTSALFGPSSAALLNAVKKLAGLDREVDLIEREAIEPIQELKLKALGNHNPRLHSDEALIALAISASTSANAAKAISLLGELRGTQAHSTVILSQVDADVYRKLGIDLTCEPQYYTKKLYHK